MENKKHGGARPGAGRKPKYENSVVMRVPEKYRVTIKALISHLDATDMIDENYSAVESKAIYLRSLKDKRQNIIFRTEPLKREV